MPLPCFHAAFPGPGQRQLQEGARPFPSVEKAPLHRPGDVVITGDTSSNHVAALVFERKKNLNILRAFQKFPFSFKALAKPGQHLPTFEL